MNIDRFLKKNAKIEISLGEYERSDITPKAVYIIGNVDGFISLMDIIIMGMNELEESMDITNLPFFVNKLGKRFIMELDAFPEEEIHGITKENETEIRWILHHYGVCDFVTSLHGFQYGSWNHLHFDPCEKESLYSVCCYLTEWNCLKDKPN
jgi:hypothetical protein